MLPALLARGRISRQEGQLLRDRPRAQPKVGRGTVDPTETGHRFEQRPLEILCERRLPRDATWLFKSDRRRDDRLVGATLRCEGHARRGSAEDRLGAGVDPERPRLEGTSHERVIQRPDRQQRLTIAGPGDTELTEESDEVAFGDAEFDVLAVLRLAPPDQRVVVIGEPVDPLAEMPDPAVV